MDGDVQPVEHLDIALFRLKVRRILVVHAEAHVQILDLQKVVPAVMVRRRRMCVMMVRLRILVRGLLVSDRGSLVRRSRLRTATASFAFSNIFPTYFCAVCGSTSFRRL